MKNTLTEIEDLKQNVLTILNEEKSSFVKSDSLIELVNGELERKLDFDSYITDIEKKNMEEPMRWGNKTLLIGGLAVGASNFFAASLQQIGIIYTSAGKAGFITAMDIVIVPFFLVLLKRKVHPLTWIGVVIAGFGLYLLCIKEGFDIELGDGLMMGCAVIYSIQILCIDYFVEKVDPFKLSFYEFVVTAILSGVFALIFETISMSDIIDCAMPILYTAILEVAVAFTLQIAGQRYAPPAIATIIMAMESVFAALSGALILGEVMTGREIIGCVIMLAAFIIAQIPEMRKEEKNSL